MLTTGRLVILACSALLCSCAAPVERTIPRIVNGEVQPGPLVSPYAYEWFLRGEVAWAEGEYEEAALAFETARAAPSEDVLLLSRLAEAYERTGDSRRADRLIESLTEDHPDSPHVWLAQGRIHEHRGKLADAIVAYQCAMLLPGGQDDATLRLSKVLMTAGHRARARELLEPWNNERTSAAKRNAQLEAALAEGNIDAILQALEPAAEQGGRQEARRIAYTALGLNQFHLAAGILGRFAETAEDRRLWVRALIRSGQSEQAREALEEQPTGAFGGPIERATLLLAVDQPMLAEKVARSAADSPAARYVIAEALLAQDRNVEAAMLFANTPKGSAHFAKARLGLVTCLRAEGLRAHALQVLADTITMDAPLDARLALDFAVAYERVGATKLGLQALDGDAPERRLARAWLLERDGRDREAQRLYAGVAEGVGRQTRLADRVRAEHEVQAGRVDVAIEILRRRAESAPEQLWDRVRLVELLLRAGRREAARGQAEALEKVVDNAALGARLRRVAEGL